MSTFEEVEAFVEKFKNGQISTVIQNTEWKLSAKGNYWRKKNGITLIVGTKCGASYWVSVDGKYLRKWEKSLELAKVAAEAGVE